MRSKSAELKDDTYNACSLSDIDCGSMKKQNVRVLSSGSRGGGRGGRTEAKREVFGVCGGTACDKTSALLT